MIMTNFTLQITTPDKEFFSGEVESLVLATEDGEMGVLAHHQLTVTTLGAAPIRFKTAEGWREAALTGGFAQIKGGSVHILADTAEWPEEIEVNRALEAKRRAEERLRTHLSEVEFLRTQVALQRAITRLSVVKKMR
jgi:F-type H+-transporting ATPase subunit epsilon